eukprot:jgi/Botrbrau1/20598/Bobra.113_1s0024.1
MIHRVTSNTQQLPMELGRSSSTGLESHSGTGAVSRIFMPAEDWKVSCLSSKYTHQLWNLWLLVPVSQSDTSLALLVLSKATSSV